VVLKVGDQSITEGQIEKAIHSLPPQAQNSVARQGKKPFGDEYVLMLVLSQEALSNHLDESPDYKETLALTRLKILAQQEYQQIVQRAVVTPEETSKYFAAHQNEFEELQVLQITVRKKPDGSKEGTPGFSPDEAKTRAEEIRQAFIAGQDPKQVAEKFQMANVVRVDSQPFTIRRGQMRADIEKAAFDLPPGQVTELFDFGTALGFVKVVSHQTGDLKSATPKIESTLRQQKITSALDALKVNSKVWMDDAYFTSPTGQQGPPKPPSMPGAAPVPK
jgi:parvulin-like peptidyl-prolyl isomerase